MTKKIPIPTNPESIVQFLAILALRKAKGEITQEEIDREMAALAECRRENDG